MDYPRGMWYREQLGLVSSCLSCVWVFCLYVFLCHVQGAQRRTLNPVRPKSAAVSHPVASASGTEILVKSSQRAQLLGLPQVPWVGSEYLHFKIFCVSFWDGLMQPPGWPWTPRVTEDDLEHLTSASEYWDHRQGLCHAGNGTQGLRRHGPAELHT